MLKVLLEKVAPELAIAKMEEHVIQLQVNANAKLVGQDQIVLLHVRLVVLETTARKNAIVKMLRVVIT